MSIGIDDAGGGSDTLQPDGLPHQQYFVVDAGRNNDFVAWLGGVNRRLNRLASCQKGRRLTPDGDSHRVDRLFAVGGCDEQFTAPRGRAAVLRLLLYGAGRHSGRNSTGDRRIGPLHVCERTSDAIGPKESYFRTSIADPGMTIRWLRSEAIVARDLLLIEWSHCGRWTAVSVAVDVLVAQRCDGEGVARTAITHPRTRDVRTGHAGDGRRGVGVVAVRMVVAFREGGGGHHRRVEISGLARHERQLIAELAVAWLVQRIRGRSRARIVHTRHHHGRAISRGVGRVDFPSRVVQASVGAKLIGIRARDFIPGPVLYRHGQIGWGEFFAELRGERIEFGGEVIGDHACVVCRDVG